MIQVVRIVSILICLLLMSCDRVNSLAGPSTGIGVFIERSTYSVSEFDRIDFEIRSTGTGTYYYNTCLERVLEEYDGENLVKTWGYPTCLCLCFVSMEPGTVITDTAELPDELLQNLDPGHSFRIVVRSFHYDAQRENPVPEEIMSSPFFQLVD